MRDFRDVSSVFRKASVGVAIIRPFKVLVIDMASDEIAGLKVEKLNGDNYHNWKFQIKMHDYGKRCMGDCNRR